MRSLSSALASALGAPVQQPAYLVEIGFSTPRRWTTFAQLTFSGFTWIPYDVRIEGLSVEAARVRGSLSIGNPDDVIGTLVLSEGVSDRSIRIWGYDGAAAAAGDMVLLADAVGGGSTVAADRVTITLRSAAEYLTCPRVQVNAASGFTTLLPAGSIVRVAGYDYRLERR